MNKKAIETRFVFLARQKSLQVFGRRRRDFISAGIRHSGQRSSHDDLGQNDFAQVQRLLSD